MGARGIEVCVLSRRVADRLHGRRVRAIAPKFQFGRQDRGAPDPRIEARRYARSAPYRSGANSSSLFDPPCRATALVAVRICPRPRAGFSTTTLEAMSRSRSKLQDFGSESRRGRAP